MNIMGIQHQENISVHGVMDKLIRSHGLLTKWDRRKAKAVSAMLNVMFSIKEVCTDQDVKDRVATLIKFQEQLEFIKTIPVVEQRSPQWHAMRKEIITASDFAQALGEGKFGSQKQIYQKKCGYEEEKGFNGSLPPLKWGTMFEPVAADIYKKRFDCELHEFGLVRHPYVDFFGASPDGITDYGIMVEIKCPFKRKITGEIPTQYYYQIQGQLDVCGLSECDYLECEFSTQDSLDDVSMIQSDLECGIILEFEDKMSSSGYSYQYSKITTKDGITGLSEWVEQCKSGTNMPFIRQHVWSLNVLNVVRVYKNDEFIKEKLSSLKEVWDKIKTYQENKDLYIAEVGASSSSSRESKKSFQNIQLTGYSFI